MHALGIPKSSPDSTILSLRPKIKGGWGWGVQGSRVTDMQSIANTVYYSFESSSLIWHGKLGVIAEQVTDPTVSLIMPMYKHCPLRNGSTASHKLGFKAAPLGTSREGSHWNMALDSSACDIVNAVLLSIKPSLQPHCILATGPRLSQPCKLSNSVRICQAVFSYCSITTT